MECGVRLGRVSIGVYTVHDLRRTGSTLLNEAGFNRDWIEKAPTLEDGRSSRAVYNKAEYAEQRRHMLLPTPANRESPEGAVAVPVRAIS